MKKILVGLVIVSFFALAFSYLPNTNSAVTVTDYSEILDDTIKKCCKDASVAKKDCTNKCTKKSDKKCCSKSDKKCDKKCDKKK